MFATTDDRELAGAGSGEEQTRARMLLRRLMADRNLRTSGISQLLSEESHTVRRMLNGSRSITLREMVLVCQLGGYSMDEVFLDNPPHAQKERPASSEESLSKVFGAIAELLSGPGFGPPAPRPKEPYVPPHLRADAAPAKKPQGRKPQADGTPKRGRGRPRKQPLGPDGLPGPQW